MSVLVSVLIAVSATAAVVLHSVYTSTDWHSCHAIKSAHVALPPSLVSHHCWCVFLRVLHGQHQVGIVTHIADVDSSHLSQAGAGQDAGQGVCKAKRTVHQAVRAVL